jgi:hypothetical protein
MLSEFKELSDRIDGLPPPVLYADTDRGSLRVALNLQLVLGKVDLPLLMSDANALRSTDLETEDPDAGGVLLETRKFLYRVTDAVAAEIKRRSVRKR